MDEPKILVVRGGAIGDFVLTLPAIRLLKEGFPRARIELLGYRHINALAIGRGYAAAGRSIEYGPLAGFFARNGDLDDALCEYFASFAQVISYLYDPDNIFAGNLKRCGVKYLISANPIAQDGDHAARQLARPLESLALYLEDHAAELHPSDEDHRAARAALESGSDEVWTMLHPGSGSRKKTWPVDRWAETVGAFLDRTPGCRLAIVGGEADGPPLAFLQERFAGTGRVRFLEGLDLPVLAALAAQCGRFLGHDSGVSHIAAAAGSRCLLLFGPTDPDVWAPANAGVEILQAPGGCLEDLDADHVLERARAWLGI